MYTQFFGLNKAPFKITPDPEFFFSGGNRGAVLEALLYAVARGEGIVKVVGEVGSGKTMLCRMLERELPDDCEIIYIANPRLSPDEILHAIAIELHLQVEKGASKGEVMRLLHTYLLEKHANNRSVVMFIEEAQGMEIETLEEIRMLSNLETTQDKLLQIVLFGQPELNDKLALHEIRQLKERITYAFDLTPLKRSEIRDYINTRIRTSGFRGNELFSPAAIRSLERRSNGLLRRINILADKGLLAAFASGEHRVTSRHLHMAAQDCEFESRMNFRPAAIVVLALLMLGGGAWWINDSASSVVANVVAAARTIGASAASVMTQREEFPVAEYAARGPTIELKIKPVSDNSLTDVGNEKAQDDPVPNVDQRVPSPLLAANLTSLEPTAPSRSPVSTAEGLTGWLHDGWEMFGERTP